MNVLCVYSFIHSFTKSTNMVLCQQVRDGPAFKDLGKDGGSDEVHPPADPQGALEPE